MELLADATDGAAQGVLTRRSLGGECDPTVQADCALASAFEFEGLACAVDEAHAAQTNGTISQFAVCFHGDGVVINTEHSVANLRDCD